MLGARACAWMPSAQLLPSAAAKPRSSGRPHWSLLCEEDELVYISECSWALHPACPAQTTESNALLRQDPFGTKMRFCRSPQRFCRAYESVRSLHGRGDFSTRNALTKLARVKCYAFGLFFISERSSELLAGFIASASCAPKRKER